MTTKVGGKKIAFGPTPGSAKPAPSVTAADQWVESRTTEPVKRLTLDLPESLHRRFKVACARRGTKMADEIRAMLEDRLREEPTA